MLAGAANTLEGWQYRPDWYQHGEVFCGYGTWDPTNPEWKVNLPQFTWNPLGFETQAQAMSRLSKETKKAIRQALKEMQQKACAQGAIIEEGDLTHFEWLALWQVEGLSLPDIRARYPTISTDMAIHKGIKRAGEFIGITPRPGRRGRRRGYRTSKLNK